MKVGEDAEQDITANDHVDDSNHVAALPQGDVLDDTLPARYNCRRCDQPTCLATDDQQQDVSRLITAATACQVIYSLSLSLSLSLSPISSLSSHSWSLRVWRNNSALVSTSEVTLSNFAE